MGRPKNGKNKQRTCEEKEQLIKEYYNSGENYCKILSFRIE